MNLSFVQFLSSFSFFLLFLSFFFFFLSFSSLVELFLISPDFLTLCLHYSHRSWDLPPYEYLILFFCVQTSTLSSPRRRHTNSFSTTTGCAIFGSSSRRIKKHIERVRESFFAIFLSHNGFQPLHDCHSQSVVVFEIVALPASLSQLVQLSEVAQHNAQR
jgi:hypothetical protein